MEKNLSVIKNDFKELPNNIEAEQSLTISSKNDNTITIDS